MTFVDVFVDLGERLLEPARERAFALEDLFLVSALRALEALLAGRVDFLLPSLRLRDDLVVNRLELIVHLLELTGHVGKLRARKLIALHEPQEQRLGAGAHAIQSLVVELELIQRRIVDSHFDLGRQPEIDLELIELRHQARLRRQKRCLRALIR